MTAPKVSVIVPVYNTEKYLRRCVDSILAQTFPDYELLLIDDGSKDTSGAICDEYAERDSRVRVFHKPNGGVSSARNIGLDNARGRYVTFVDSDDWVEREMLASMALCVAEGSGTVFCGTQILSGHKGVGFSFKKDEAFPSIEEYLARYDIRRNPWGILLERDLIERKHIRFNTELVAGEDTIFNMEYFAQCEGKVYCASGRLYVYNDIRTESACHNVSMETCLSFMKGCMLMPEIPTKGNAARYMQQLCKKFAKHFLHNLRFLYYPPSPLTRSQFIDKYASILQVAYNEAFDHIAQPGVVLTFARHHFMSYIQYCMDKQ